MEKEQLNKLWEKLTKKQKMEFLVTYSNYFSVSTTTFFRKRTSGEFTQAEKDFLLFYFKKIELI